MSRKTGTLTNLTRFPDRWITLESGAVISTPASLGNHFKVRLTEDCTVEPPNLGHDGQHIVWRFEQPAGGGVSVTFNSGAFSTANGTAAVDTGASVVTYVQARFDQQEAAWTILGTGGDLASSDLIDSSAGAGDAGKPIKLDSGGHLDPSFVETGATIIQTYSTTATNHANRQAAGRTDSTGGSPGGGLGPISGTGADTDLNNNFASILEELDDMRADMENTAQVLNQVIDLLQVLQKPG